MKIKKETSERSHNVIEQPPDTCPMLDEVAFIFDELQSELKVSYENFEKDDLINLIDKLSRIIDYSVLKTYHLGVTDYTSIENVRKNVIKIREWGNEWKDKALEYYEQIT